MLQEPNVGESTQPQLQSATERHGVLTVTGASAVVALGRMMLPVCSTDRPTRRDSLHALCSEFSDLDEDSQGAITRQPNKSRWCGKDGPDHTTAGRGRQAPVPESAGSLWSGRIAPAASATNQQARMHPAAPGPRNERPLQGGGVISR